MQATRLLQHNNPPQNQSQTSQVQSVYKYWNQLKYYSSHLINKVHSHMQETKNTSNMNLNHLIIPSKPPTCFNTTTHHKTNHKHYNYNAYKGKNWLLPFFKK